MVLVITLEPVTPWKRFKIVVDVLAIGRRS